MSSELVIFHVRFRGSSLPLHSDVYLYVYICMICIDQSLGNVKTDETLTDRGIFVSQPWWCLYNCSPILVFMVIFLDLSNKHFFWRRFSSFEFTLSFSLTLFSYVTIYKFWGILKLLKNISHCFYTTFKSCN